MTYDRQTWFVKSWGMLLTGTTVLFLIALLVPAILHQREAARKTQSRYNLKQLGLALHNYHDTVQCFPPGGVFNEEGTEFHDWSTFIDPYLWAAPFYNKLNFNVPWDDPLNLDIFIQERNPAFLNPTLSTTHSPDGLHLNHYAASQLLLFRNSSVRLSDLTDKSSTVLLGESNGKYPPRGYPYNWRDPSIALKTSSDGFGCEMRKSTLLLMADGNVKEFHPQTAEKVLSAIAGSPKDRPVTEDVAKPSEPYRIGERKRWKYLWIYGGKTIHSIRLSPDESLLIFDIKSDGDFAPNEWVGKLQAFIADKPIKEIVIKGRLAPDELELFLSLPQLKNLTPVMQ